MSPMDVDPITLRPATNEDAAHVRAVVLAVRDEFAVACDPACGADDDLDDIEGTYVQRGGAFKVLELADGTIVGAVGLYPVRPGVCELRKMYVLREARGLGLGKRMMTEMLADARRLGFHRIELETSSALEAAAGLYRSFGFRPVAPEHLWSQCDAAYALDLDERQRA